MLPTGVRESQVLLERFFHFSQGSSIIIPTWTHTFSEVASRAVHKLCQKFGQRSDFVAYGLFWVLPACSWALSLKQGRRLRILFIRAVQLFTGLFQDLHNYPGKVGPLALNSQAARCSLRPSSLLDVLAVTGMMPSPGFYSQTTDISKQKAVVNFYVIVCSYDVQALCKQGLWGYLQLPCLSLLVGSRVERLLSRRSWMQPTTSSTTWGVSDVNGHSI